MSVAFDDNHFIIVKVIQGQFCPCKGEPEIIGASLFIRTETGYKTYCSIQAVIGKRVILILLKRCFDNEIKLFQNLSRITAPFILYDSSQAGRSDHGHKRTWNAVPGAVNDCKDKIVAGAGIRKIILKKNISAHDIFGHPDDEAVRKVNIGPVQIRQQ